ncbi:RecQ family ATP-dependent DNA helicase [Flavobacterium agricola]|uniref:ATP-dependent DNA helicase RecQ n=1 Tax=Flavobacterium agricola TaxID=2870839 RepID=A0ABY6LVT1_9FLAO|nr:ATP-dependent DNA helicase RecQ [Flavobacterium agricola]UYW00442.1 RecQ family ATP-dependent DNA helicase [Flavobacterium agricola]
MTNALDVLKKYWGFDEFRAPQNQIIESVLNGNDTLALLPTGGGKSICFQVPALMKPGICLVVSPLIALIQDQIQNLEKKNIKALTLSGGLSFTDTSNLLDNLHFGGYKFLYISPEKLQTDWIFERIQKLNINLIAIDEAHCISQWGHDFRPAYTQLKKLRESFKNIPIIALTASATPKVQADICTQLDLKNVAVFKKSFTRENLAYFVVPFQDKLYKIQQILTKNTGTSIIYVTSRKACIEIANQLNSLQFKATYFHGGISRHEKQKNMDLWLQNQVQVIVATNAFGMGIDKPDVRTVIHYHVPENLENYYQEAGRAGRDGQKAFAIILNAPHDITNTENQFLSNLPTKDFVQLIYKKLNQYFRIAYAEGQNETFTFSLEHFCMKYDLPITKTYNAIQFLDTQGVISLSKEFNNQAKMQFVVPSKEIIRYCSIYNEDANIVESILRMYPGIFEIEMAIRIEHIAAKNNTTNEKVVAVLNKLAEKQIAEIDLSTTDSKITFNQIREDELTINRIAKNIKRQNQDKIERFEAIKNYITDETLCKNKIITAYFDEAATADCGICSVCIAKKGKKTDAKSIRNNILTTIQKQPKTARELEQELQIEAEQLLSELLYLLEEEQIKVNDKNKYHI